MKQQDIQRNHSLDLVKGITAVLMVLSHVGTALKGDNPTNALLSPVFSFINLTTFTTLFFLSGAGIYLATLRHDISQEEFAKVKPKLFKKALLILGGYYFLAILADFKLLSAPGNDILTELLKILLFYRIPEYTEYLLAFILVYLLVLASRRLLKIIAHNFWLTLATALASYLLGFILFNYQFSSEFNNIQLLLVGVAGKYSYPLLQYLPVFLFGAYWAHLNIHRVTKIAHSQMYSALTSVVVFMFFLGLQLLISGRVSIDNRWPPDAVFLSVGLVYVTNLLFLTQKVTLGTFFNTIGRNLFGFFMLHLTIIFIGIYAIPYLGGLASAQIILLIFVLISASSYLGVKVLSSHRLILKIKATLNQTSVDEISIRLLAILIIVGLIGVATWKILPFNNNVVEQNPEYYDPRVIGLITERVNLNTIIDRKWILKVADNTSYDEYRAGIFNIDVDDSGFGYWGVEVLIDGEVVKSFEYNKINVYNYAVYAKDLAVGTHTISARLTGTNKISDPVEIIISEPLYVTWTIDWEGYDITDANMKALDKISKDYQVPMVQLVNPRTFTASDINAFRKDQLKKWITTRMSKGDEIGLHLHMRLDLIEYCGITPRISPKWSNNPTTTGHDVLTPAYTKEEFDMLIKCSLKIFQENKFPKPLSYRAGGWFIDLKDLKVLKQNGFLYDTSGRDKYTWGIADGFWDLAATTRPYLISNTDQNKSDPNNNFGLLEVPNNGMDTTNQHANILINKFDTNYPHKNKPLEQMQVLTYMSHPHWVTAIDKPQLETLYNNIKPYTADNDSGPVVYTTIKDIYSLNTND